MRLDGIHEWPPVSVNAPKPHGRLKALTKIPCVQIVGHCDTLEAIMKTAVVLSSCKVRGMSVRADHKIQNLALTTCGTNSLS